MSDNLNGSVTVAKEAYEEILTHSKGAYPHECCGMLLGSFNKDGSKNITARAPLTNTNSERANDRYEIDPGEMLMLEKEARKNGLDVVGIYHSHPDHPSRPSQFDRDRGWPDYSYIIVACEKGVKTEAKSWSFENPDDPFTEEELIIKE
ncbi:MAG: M67 family metallopeptidase [Deltaproteobacteria bacterium]|nr:M67 family metallopeptidase [Deltaproteobacteria bacterium]